VTAEPVYLEELAYHPDSCALFERIRALPGAVFLDSGHPYSDRGRFDILAAQPVAECTLTCSESTTYDDIVGYFSNLLELWKSLFAGVTAPSEDLPFCGGLAGHIDYGVGRPLQHLPPEPGSVACLQAYPWAVIQDHLLQRSTFLALPSLPAGERREILDRLHEPVSPTGCFRLLENFRPDLDYQGYRDAFRQVQRYILAGDCYQVNLARRFTAAYEGDPWHAYRLLRPVAGAPYGGYLVTRDDRQLLSLSPERFLQLHGQHVETRPIKGTRPRHADRKIDELAGRELRNSAKDRAENLMIVDLLRNDIGRSCTAGSIHVDRLFELESFPTVHHLVSTISGELLPERSAFELLRDCFPGGSITGAPKRRAMEIIDSLESGARGAYCGSLLYVSADGRMDSNIAIRTLQAKGGSIQCWGGGGLVADSDWELEYQETWDKVGRFLQVLEATREGSGSGIAV
jgi:para-aminobenzoate synthetase component 1